MSQHSDSKPETKSNQPTLTELTPEQLDKVTGGDKAQTTNKVSMSDLHFTKTVDKASP